MKPENGYQSGNCARNVLWRLALVLGAIVLLAAGAGAWLTTSTSGLRWLGSTASHLSEGKISLEGLDGKLSQSIKADVVSFRGNDLLVVARGLQLNWQPDALLSGRLNIVDLI